MARSDIELRHVEMKFKGRAGNTVVALQDVSMTVGDGEFVCLLGPSGCGKSTVLNLVAGFLTPTSGRLMVGGRPVPGPRPDRGVVFQDHALFPWLNVMDNVTFGPRMRGVPRSEYEPQAVHLLEEMGLSQFRTSYVSELSGGMRQRVAIARALINDPAVLLMDEPFGALDAQTRVVMQELLLRIWSRHRKTVLFVTHDIDEAIFMADRIYVMSRRPGRIQEEISVEIPRPRDYSVLTTQAFGHLKRRIIELIWDDAVTAAGGGAV